MTARKTGKNNERIMRAKAREMKAKVEDILVDSYYDDEMKEYRCPVLTLQEIIERAANGDDFVAAVMSEQFHKYMKMAVRKVMYDGLPCVLVNLKFCEEVSDDEYESAADDIKKMKSWIAGLGAASKAAGVLFCEYDATGQAMYSLMARQGLIVTNGHIRRVVAMFEAGASKQLPGMNPRSSLVREIRNTKLLPHQDS